MKRIHFFALKQDLLILLELVDSKNDLRYVRSGNSLTREINDELTVFDTGEGIPNLGTASADSSTTCEAYLVCKRESAISLRRFQGIGGERVCIDQLANPDTVEFSPAGVWDEDIVLQGRIATASESRFSQALMKRFHTAIQKTFSKVKAFYVGPEALALLGRGKRLTSSAKSPREFDLAPLGTTN